MRAPARRYPLSAGTAFTGQGSYRGFTVRETAAAAAVVKIHDGTSATGALLAAINLAANGSAHFDCDVRFSTGVFVEVASGTVEGALFIG